MISAISGLPQCRCGRVVKITGDTCDDCFATTAAKFGGRGHEASNIVNRVDRHRNGFERNESGSIKNFASLFAII